MGTTPSVQTIVPVLSAYDSKPVGLGRDSAMPYRLGGTYDLFPDGDLLIPAGRSKMVDTGVALDLDPANDVFCMISTGSSRCFCKMVGSRWLKVSNPGSGWIQCGAGYPLARMAFLKLARMDLPGRRGPCGPVYSPGHELFPARSVRIPPGAQADVETGIRLDIPLRADYIAFVTDISPAAETDCVVVGGLSRSSSSVTVRNLGRTTARLAPKRPVARVVFLKTAACTGAVSRFGGFPVQGRLSAPRDIAIGPGMREEMDSGLSFSADCSSFVYFVLDDPSVAAEKDCLITDRIFDPARCETVRVCMRNFGTRTAIFRRGEAMATYALVQAEQPF